MTFPESWYCRTEKRFLIDVNNEMVEHQVLEHFR